MKVHPASLNEMYIEWDQEGDLFTLFRSTSPETGYMVVAEHIEQPFYMDGTVNLYDPNLRYYYKVEGFRDGDRVSTSNPSTLEYNVKDGVAHKIIYEARKALLAMKNPPVHFLLKKRSGARCPECWNPVTKRIRYSNCSACNGTGFLTGYHIPIQAKVSQDISQLAMNSGELDGDKVSLSPIRAWTTNYPLLTPEDVMVDVLNRRYKVVNVSRRTKSQYVIRQVLDLVPLESGHPAYGVEVPRER